MKNSAKAFKAAFNANAPAKVNPMVYPLTTSAGRAGLLLSITAGMVGHAEVEAAVLNDVAPRQYRKPVVVEDIRFPAVRDAALYLVAREKIKNKLAYARRLDALRKQITNWCNADNVAGYYWSA